MPKGALIAAMDFSPVDEGEFHDWYDMEHLPERQRVPGFINGARWIGADNPKLSVATYDLDDVAVLHGPDYGKIGGANLSPWSKRIVAKVTQIMRYEGVQILPGDGIAPAGAGGLLLVGMTPGAAVEAAFNAWYDDAHVPALAAVPGVLSARRFRTSGAGPKYVALYHLTGPGVVESPQWKDASASTAMPTDVREQITNRLRLVCRSYVRS
jgi:hypothetical protein